MLPTTTERDTALTTQSWGTEGTSSKDLVVPKIQVAQATSNACKEGQARPGEILHSLTKEVLATKGAKLEFLPILCIPSWVFSKVVPGGSPEFLRKEPLTRDNDSDQWNQELFEDGNPVVKNKCLTFLVLLASRVNAFPFFIDFQKTGKNAGKLLSTIIQENGFLGKPAPARVVELTTTLKTYKNNSWFAFGVTPTRDATKEELEACKKWFDIFSAKEAQVMEAVPVEDDGVL